MAANARLAMLFDPIDVGRLTLRNRLFSAPYGTGLQEGGHVNDELLAYTDRRTVLALSGLPRGCFAAEGVVDSDGYTPEPVRLRARLVVDDDGVLFDLTGSDRQRRAPVNSTYAQTFSACAYVLKCLVGADVPVNDGFYRHVRIVAPQGTVVNCTAPAPVVGGWETQTRLVDILLRALALALPEAVPAGTKVRTRYRFYWSLPSSKPSPCPQTRLLGPDSWLVRWP